MATQSKDISWDFFKWVVGALFAAIVALLAFIFTGFKSDLGDVRIKLDSATTEMHQNHVELVKTISAIGGKLDQLSQDKRPMAQLPLDPSLANSLNNSPVSGNGKVYVLRPIDETDTVEPERRKPTAPKPPRP